MTPATAWLIPGLVGYGLGLGVGIFIWRLGSRDADKPPYTIVAAARASSDRPWEGGVCAGIVCGTCGMTSWNPRDVLERYCGKCHVFHEAGRGAGERV